MTQSTPIRAGIIMAGGSGERFWPLSRKLRPKQLLCLSSPAHTMLEEAVDRLRQTIPVEHIFISTTETLRGPIRDAALPISGDNVIAEPAKRNTLGALCYAAAGLMARYGGNGDHVTMAIVTADHQIGQPERFRETIERAMTLAEVRDALVTIGILPVQPETGYGYIQTGEPLETGESENHAFRVKAFHEKPSAERAEVFVKSGSYYWNSGMFFWKVSTFLKELEAVRADAAAATRDMAAAMQAGDDAAVRAAFDRLDDISIDYALMEHAKNVLVVRASFPWDDVGSWTALDRTHGHDAEHNVAIGGPVLVDTRNCIVYNAAGADTIAVALVGCEGLVVVTTPDAVLVMPKDRAQDVRKAVNQLKNRNARQL